jgi:hypothetical protein
LGWFTLDDLPHPMGTDVERIVRSARDRADRR